MKLGFALVYIGFYGSIATACFVTSSALPLFALFLTPSITIKTDDKSQKEAKS